MWYKALLEVLQHQMELLSPRLQKADLEHEEDTCALLAAACLHAKAFSGLMGVTKSHQRKQVLASAEGRMHLLFEWQAAKMLWECLIRYGKLKLLVWRPFKTGLASRPMPIMANYCLGSIGSWLLCRC